MKYKAFHLYSYFRRIFSFLLRYLARITSPIDPSSKELDINLLQLVKQIYHSTHN